MANLARVSLTFGLPLLALSVTAGAVWLASSGTDEKFGPMLRVPFQPHVAAPEGGANLPPNMDEKLDPVQAALRNAALPFSRGSLLLPARYGATPSGGEDPQAALNCLTSAIYYEAGSEPLAGKEAVAQVVVNRWASASFPKTICGVVQQGAPYPGCQFTFECDGSLSRRPEAASWTASRVIAQAAMNGFTFPLVGGATHYHADYVFPVWATSMIKLAKIGQHIFYRWPGARLNAAPLSASTTFQGPPDPNPDVPLAPAVLPAARLNLSPPQPDATAASALAAKPPAASYETVGAPGLSPPPAPIDPVPALPSRPTTAPSRRAIPEQSLRGGPF